MLLLGHEMVQNDSLRNEAVMVHQQCGPVQSILKQKNVLLKHFRVLEVVVLTVGNL